MPLVAGVARPAALRLGAGVEPVTTFAESPAGNFGASPKAAPALDWNATLELEPGERTGLTIGYFGTLRSVSFSGPASARGTTTAPPANGAMSDAKLSETIQGLTVGALFQF